ncbi:MAG: 1,4-dihydroxy-6-naphthoate synthase [Deltaproteobacteria bacterium]|jgi:5,8-dihydroxy-2-naphthoate synthase|nr:1,4-dihydroxy-6-naphthoate synthase [Deltaproteobacteria bacterium]
MKIKLGISPCPNDTFMFYHLINSNQFNLNLTIVDVEELNHKVLNHELDISKVSIYTAMQVMDHYNLLDSGAALGENCGPLLVAKEKNVKKMKDAKIAIPGRYTTANLLFSLYTKNEGRKVFMPFSQIMPAVEEGLVDFGVIIHEGRFTYKNYGLAEVADLGKWWENLSKMPIPLGGIVSRRELPTKFVKEFTKALHDSISRALSEKEYQNSPIYSYVREHAQEMEKDVIKKHIDLYVNDYSLSLGEDGRRAVDKLFNMAKEII